MISVEPQVALRRRRVCGGLMGVAYGPRSTTGTPPPIRDVAPCAVRVSSGSSPSGRVAPTPRCRRAGSSRRQKYGSRDDVTVEIARIPATRRGATRECVRVGRHIVASGPREGPAGEQRTEGADELPDLVPGRSQRHTCPDDHAVLISGSMPADDCRAGGTRAIGVVALAGITAVSVMPSSATAIARSAGCLFALICFRPVS